KEASVKVNAKGYKGIMSLTMKEFAALSAPIFKKIYVPIQNVLRDSGNKPEDIDEVIVVGGSGKMPIVQQYLKHILKKDKLYVYEPDKIVALGMGVYAGIKERDEDVKDVILTDVAPFSLGISTVNYT
ncbi:Hsp70 family protein, partial [Vibrio sp. FNV 38]|nr:Hsp70 family protein [Vibrio sp. FNV 38]